VKIKLVETVNQMGRTMDIELRDVIEIHAFDKNDLRYKISLNIYDGELEIQTDGAMEIKPLGANLIRVVDIGI
jgi:hypothetical protein